ncbi:MAG: cytochrome c [Actinomycetota bacterium]|nr:cytochrome c [Actinomycetota bacterium]MDQ2984421.1 cytochrome c [Actinomycetota bacterium]
MLRRVLPVAFLVLAVAGCGYEGTVLPTAEKVVGSLPTKTTPAPGPPGNAAAGKAVFASSGCGTCHTFKPAGTSGTIGPDLDKLAQYAKKANQGSLAEFTRESIENPGSYVEPGYQNIMPPDGGKPLAPKQLADLVAFLTQKSG